METLILVTLILIEISIFFLWLFKFSQNLKIQVKVFWIFILLTFYVSVDLFVNLIFSVSSSPTRGSESMAGFFQGLEAFLYIPLILVSSMILVLGLIFNFTHEVNKSIQKRGIASLNVGPSWVWFLIITSLLFFIAFSPSHPITFMMDKIERIQKIFK